MVAPDDSSAKEPFKCQENLAIARMLHDHKFRKHLVADRHLWVRLDADVKATFRINESNYPVCTKFHTSLPNWILGVWPLRIPNEFGFLRIAQSRSLLR